MVACICLCLLSHITINLLFKYFRKSLLRNYAKWLQHREMVLWIEINFMFQSSNQFLAMRHGKLWWVGPQPSYAGLSYFLLKCLCSVKRWQELLGLLTVQENNNSLDFPLTPLTYADTWEGIYLCAQNLPFLSSSETCFPPGLAVYVIYVICTFCCCTSGKPLTALQIVTSHIVFIITPSF